MLGNCDAGGSVMNTVVKDAGIEEVWMEHINIHQNMKRIMKDEELPRSIG